MLAGAGKNLYKSGGIQQPSPQHRLSTPNTRRKPRNQTRPFYQVAKPLMLPRPFRSRSKSRSRPTGEPEPRSGGRQAPLQPVAKACPPGRGWSAAARLNFSREPQARTHFQGGIPGMSWRGERTRGARAGHTHTRAHSHLAGGCTARSGL